MLNIDLTIRLHNTLRDAGVLISGVSGVSIPYVAANVRISPSSLQAASQSIINAFDPSQAAQDAYEDSLEPLLKTLRNQAAQALTDIDTYLVIADTATNVQVRAEVKALDQRMKGIIQALNRLIQKVWR